MIKPAKFYFLLLQSEDGDIIDCIDIYKQPGLDHPALKNHIIQVKYTFGHLHSFSKFCSENSSLCR